MKLSLLYQLFKNEITVNKFKSEVKFDIERYKEQLTEKGRSVNIEIIEDHSIYITEKDILTLCHFYLQGDCNEYEIQFICDCLTMTEFVTMDHKELISMVEDIADNHGDKNSLRKTISDIVASIE